MVTFHLLKNNIKKIKLLLLLLLFNQIAFTQSGWIIQNNIGNYNLTDIQFYNINTGYITGNLINNNLLYITTNCGTNWSSVNTGIGYISNIYISNDTNFKLMGTIGNNGLIRFTNNSGQSWNDFYFSPNLEILSASNMDWLNINTGYTVWVDYGHSNYYGRIFKTTNGGINWFEQTPLPQLDYYVDVKFKSYDTAFILSGLGLYRTTNYGQNWNLFSNMFYGSNKFFFPNFDTIYVCGSLGKVLRSIDGGLTFTLLSTNVTSQLLNIYFVNTKTGWVIGDSGLIINTTNAGLNWQIQNGNTVKTLRNIYFIDEKTGWVVGDSGTLLKTTTGGAVFIKKIKRELPFKFEIYQNYPNPFNPVTNIQFDLPKYGFVKLVIYDILGREIKTLVNEIKNPGNYIITFNGSELASGVYFYRIQSGDFVQVKKMVLIK